MHSHEDKGSGLVQYVKQHINKSIAQNRGFGPEYIAETANLINTFLDSGSISDFEARKAFSTLQKMIAGEFVLPGRRKASFAETEKACIAISQICRLNYEKGINELRTYSEALLRNELGDEPYEEQIE